MNSYYYNNLQIREVFHLEFLRAFARKLKPSFFALKGGVNMRLSFGSIRYSEDMDLDVNTINVKALSDTVMKILGSVSFQNELKGFGIDKVLPPNMAKAKQTDTTQRFKVHLITHQGEDLFTKIEFSRRKSVGNAVVEPVSEKILRQYKMSPLIVSHYDVDSAFAQKINALANRSAVQARDIFDLYMLSTQLSPNKNSRIKTDAVSIKIACENVFLVSFHQFRDTVLSYLAEEDKAAYDSPDLWDEIKLRVHDLICQNN
ncbi:MAG: nucleotidyl transferase AbiEii/AbiGii toxin family protein [Endomicrobiales bacterium]|nr:nucleotidyl transferase AbiEii/AbiGii toxin family protein [Endomicrobiales bacterium]